MLCPICGCQQRKADVCVQCHAPLFAKIVKEEDGGGALEGLSPLNIPEQRGPERRPDRKSGGPGPEEVRPASPPREETPPSQKKEAHQILVTTTQRVEGKRIATYHGLIHAAALIEASDPVSAAPQTDGYRKRFKAGVSEALQNLRQEAAHLKSNAVVAVSFDYQRIDSKTILLSAAGTAVFVKDR